MNQPKDTSAIFVFFTVFVQKVHVVDYNELYYKLLLYVL